MDGPNAGREVPVLLVDAVGQIVRLEVAVRVSDDPPNHGEDQPGQHEAGGEGQDRVAPRHVDGRREDVPDKGTFHFGHVLELVVDLTSLGDQTLPNFLGQLLGQLGSNSVGICGAILQETTTNAEKS